MHYKYRHVKKPISKSVLKITLSIALSLGLAVSIFLITLDLNNDKQRIMKDAESLAAIVIEPAAAIAFSLDTNRAEGLVNGILTQPSVYQAKILLNNDRVLIEQDRGLEKENSRWLSDYLFEKNHVFSYPLHSPIATSTSIIGYLEFSIDSYTYAQSFINRSLWVLLGFIIYSLVISFASLFVFYSYVTRPLASTIQSIANLSNNLQEAKISQPQGHEKSEIGILVNVANKHLEDIQAVMLKLKNTEDKLKKHSDELELTVEERTRDLTQSLEQLKSARDKLIESEKLAALGGLVAGVAHEVNTPLGISVTATSILSESLQNIKSKFADKSLSSQDFENYLTEADEVMTLLTKNMNRASKLISDFKRTAVDQTSEGYNEFNVSDTLSSLIASLHPELKKTKLNLELHCASDIKMKSYPGSLSQVFSNLILNSVNHAFDGIDHPSIIINVEKIDEQNVLFEYRDNGNGIDASLHQKIFEPFFTTKRGQGGSGLGLNIVYNIVNQKLIGTLHFDSSPGNGVYYHIELPTITPHKIVESSE